MFRKAAGSKNYQLFDIFELFKNLPDLLLPVRETMQLVYQSIDPAIAFNTLGNVLLGRVVSTGFL